MSPKPPTETLERLNDEASLIPDDRVYRWLVSTHLSQDLVDLIYDLMEKTRVIAGRVLRIGKIIVLKLIEFAKAHPGLAIGVALGAGLACLMVQEPWVGPAVGPLATALGIFVGAAIGHGVDHGRKLGEMNWKTIAADGIAATGEVLRLLAEALRAAFAN
jgi:hypothetical protein